MYTYTHVLISLFAYSSTSNAANQSLAGERGSKIELPNWNVLDISRGLQHYAATL